MESVRTGFRGLRSSPRPIRQAHFVVGMLAATVWIGPEVIKYPVLVISMSYVLIAAYWEGWRLIDAPTPPDLCERCKRGIIARVAMSRHGDRFYRCESCGAHYQRKMLGGPWVDASGLQYEAMYSRQVPSGQCKSAPLAYEDSTYWTRTVSVLLVNKRIRQLARDACCGDKVKLSSTKKRMSSTAQLPREQGGLWDSDLDG